MEVRESDALREQVMWLVSADMTGLWEVLGIANEQFSPRPARDRRKLARRVVGELFARGWVELYEQHPDDVPDVDNVPVTAKPVEGARVDAALEDDLNWDSSGVREVYTQYLLRVTARGKHEFQEQLRKEGKVR